MGANEEGGQRIHAEVLQIHTSFGNTPFRVVGRFSKPDQTM
jgi:hypothetical protein